MITASDFLKWLNVFSVVQGGGHGPITFPLPLALGGTHASLTADLGGIVYSGSTGLVILAHTTTANQLLLSGASAAPSWSTATYPATTTANQLLYSSATNTVAGLATANRAFLITNAAGVPAITNSISLTETLTGFANPGNPVLNMSNSTGMTYPTAPFSVTVGPRLSALLTTSQTINSGGTSVVNGANFAVTYDGSGTNDLSTLNVGVLAISSNWSSSNTCAVLINLANTLTYRGSDVSARTTTLLNGTLDTVILNPPSSSTATVAVFKGIDATLKDSSTSADSVTSATKNITSFKNFRANAQVLNSGASNISNISNLTLYDSIVTLNGAGAGAQVNITDFIGLYLATPTKTGTVTITNNYGIKQDDTTATNAFAGPITAPSIDFGGGALNAYTTKAAFTPTITCTTPGDLSVSYTTQFGEYTQIGPVVFFKVVIAATPTRTTASGTLQVAGFPVASTLSNCPFWVQVGGATYSIPANLTGYIASIPSTSTTATVSYLRTTAGSSIGLPITQFPSGNLMIVEMTGFYFVQ